MNSILLQKKWFIVSFLLFITSPSAHASELIYTIQAASFSSEVAALKYYNSLEHRLNRNELDHLRIEKIGAFYSVRLGKFDDRRAIRLFLKSIKRRISSAIIMKAYLKEERLIRFYSAPKSVDSATVEESTPGQPETEKAGAQIKNVNPLAAALHQANGDRYWEINRHFLAIDEYRQAISYGLNHPDLYWKLAKILYITGFLGEAVIEMEKAVKLKPGLDVFRIELGILYLADNKLEQAKEQFLAAIEINPSLTQVYIYLGYLSLRKEDYDMAWSSVKMAQQLGYKGEDLSDKLRLLTAEPARNPWYEDGEYLYMRQILVDSEEQAEAIVNRIAKGELFELISGVESTGPNALQGGYVGNVRPSDLHPSIAEVLVKRDVFSDPVIVKTENGFHIVQRIAPFAFSFRTEPAAHASASDRE